jgi:hypothetical protein
MSGPVATVANQTWSGVNAALGQGRRGLPGGSSLAQLLAERRGVRNFKRLPRLTREQILCWADDHFRRQGQWPTNTSGPVLAMPGENWSAVHTCLHYGLRGLAGGSSLARLLAEARHRRNRKALPPLRLEHILSWARAHYQRTGKMASQTVRACS